MLRKYSCSGIRFVTGFSGRYFLKNNDIFETESNKKVNTFIRDSEEYLELILLCEKVVLKKAVAVCLASKRPMFIHSDIPLLDVLYVDGDRRNTNPENLIWKFPEEGIRIGKSDFRIIPGLTRYAINEKGWLYSRIVDKYVSSYIDNSGYVMFGVNPDIGQRTIVGQHRLLCLAFKPYPENVDGLDVNHINGIKNCNTLSNLEWASRKRNSQHAYQNGLRTDNIPVLIKNIFTGEVRQFYSIEEASRSIGIDSECMRERIATDGRRVYYPGILFKTKDSNSEWMNIESPVDAVLNSRAPIPLIIENIENKEVTVVKNMSEAARVTDIPLWKMYKIMLPRTPVTENGFIISYPSFENTAKSFFTEM